MEQQGVTNDKRLRPVLVTSDGAIVTGTNGIQAPMVFSEYLRNNGSNEMNVDGSAVPVDFSITCPEGQSILLERAMITIEGGTTDFNSGKFGNINALSNGVDVIIIYKGFEAVVSNFFSNLDLARAMYDFSNPFKNGAYVGRWTFSKDTGSKPIRLEAGESALFRIQDNLTGLDSFKVITRGVRQFV